MNKIYLKARFCQCVSGLALGRGVSGYATLHYTMTVISFHLGYRQTTQHTVLWKLYEPPPITAYLLSWATQLPLSLMNMDQQASEKIRNALFCPSIKLGWEIV